MKFSLYALLAVLPVGVANADNPSHSFDGGNLQLSDTRGHGQQLLAMADNSDDDRPGNAKGKGKGKAKGKAKGHDKDKDKNGDSQTEAAKDKSSESAAPQVQPSAAPTAPAAAAPQATTPATATPAAPKPAASASQVSATPSTRSAAEVKAQIDQRLTRITALDKNTATSNARYAALSKETGIPVATLQAQQKSNAIATGGLLIANEMAKATGKPAATFFKQRAQGKDWSRIAAENNFDLATVLPKLERVQKAMEAVHQPPKR